MDGGRRRHRQLLAYGRTDLFTDGKEEFGQDMAGTIHRPEVIADLERAVTLRPKWGIKRIHDDGVVIDSAGAFAPTSAPCASARWTSTSCPPTSS